jgi:hypothetical protein
MGLYVSMWALCGCLFLYFVDSLLESLTLYDQPAGVQKFSRCWQFKRRFPNGGRKMVAQDHGEDRSRALTTVKVECCCRDASQLHFSSIGKIRSGLKGERGGGGLKQANSILLSS